MLHLERTAEQVIDAEMRIINSDPFFNRISKGKETLSAEEVSLENQESRDLGAERYFIKEGQRYIGLLEFLPLNPGDQYPWLGLLLTHKAFQSKGYGFQTLQLLYAMLQERGVRTFRIGVIAENEPAHRFWQRQGFVEVRTTVKDGKEIVIYESLRVNK